MNASQVPHHPTMVAAKASVPRTSSHATGVRVVTDAVQDAGAWIPRLKSEVSRALLGHEVLLDRLLIALLADGHLLLEGSPGTGKQLAVRTFAAAIGGEFRHLPCTADLDRYDLTGSSAEPGPIFANVLYAEDLDQAPPKVRAALVHAAKDRTVRVDGAPRPLPEPFLVVATSSPTVGSRTFDLTSVQRDRFLMKAVVAGPDAVQERALIDVASPGLRMPEVRPVADLAQVRRARMVLAAIFMDGRVKDYVVRIVQATRRPDRHDLPPADHLRFAASPRATLGLVAAAKARAFLDGRGSAEHRDVRAVAPDVLRHRAEMSPETHDLELPTSEDIIQRILEVVPVD